MGEEFEYYMLCAQHCILFVLSLYCIIKCLKNLVFMKSPNKNSIMFIFDTYEFPMLLFCGGYAYFEFEFIRSYLNEEPMHFYEAYAMTMQIIFMSQFIFKKES